MTHTVSVPLGALADAVGSSPDDLRPTLVLAERLGSVWVRGDRVELPAQAVERLGLFRRADGRWALDPADRESSGRRPRTLPLIFEGGHADPRAEEPWQEMARAEEPPPDRVASVHRWLNRWAAARPPDGAGASPAGPNPQQPWAPGRPGTPARPRPVNPPKPPPRAKTGTGRNSFDLVALRARLDAAARAAG